MKKQKNDDTVVSFLKNSSAILLAKALTLSLSFLLIPLIIQKLGIKAYGSWEVYLAVGAIASIPSSIISGTLLWLSSQAYGEKNQEKIIEIAGNAIFLWLIFSAFCVAIGFIFSKEIAIIFGVASPDDSHVNYLITLAILTCSISGLADILVSILSGLQRSGLAHLIQAMGAILGGLLSIFLLFIHPSIETLLVSQVCNFISAAFGLRFLLRKLNPNIHFNPRPPKLILVKQARKYSAFVLLGIFATALRDNTDRLLLAATTSAEAVANYAVANRLAAILLILSTFFYTPAVATAGRLYGEKRLDEIAKLYSNLCTAVLIIVGAATVLIAGFAEQIFILWLGRQYKHAHNILLWLLIGNFCAILFTSIGTAIGKGTGLIKPETYYIVVCLLLNIILKLVLLPILGGDGTVIATSASWAIGSLVFLWLFHKHSLVRAKNKWRLLTGASAVILSVAILRWIDPFVTQHQPSRMETLLMMPVHVTLALTLFTIALIMTKSIKSSEIGAIFTFFLKKK